ncbi:MAG: protein kinase domain-containing protein, partial [Planctomycetaceae bacterium]
LQAQKVRQGEPGDLVLGPYRLLYCNAAGSYARVYRASDVRSGRMVGVKVLRARHSEDRQAVEEFRREAELGKGMRHPNIVPIYEVAEEKGQHYISMEFVEGGNLRDFIAIRKKLAPVEATRCVLDLAEGLAYAASRGATHRDLKMTNVLMSTTGVAKLVDFGLASLNDSSGETESAARALEYATLEKNTGAPRDDPRSDLYFLGTIYYELLTGVPPLPRTRDRQERSQFSRYLAVRPVRQLEPTLPTAVSVVVDRLLQLNPHLRYQTAAEAAGDLRKVLKEAFGEAGGAAASATAGGGSEKAAPSRSVMCLETRPRQQELLRDYFTKHGFRVLMLTDLGRGLARLSSNPPDAVVVIGEAFGAEVLHVFPQWAAQAEARRLGIVLSLSADLAEGAGHLPESEQVRILRKPTTLRDLRTALEQAMEAAHDG